MLKIFISMIVSSLFIGLFYPFFTATSEVEITKVVDGDTMEVKEGGKTWTVRLKGVDTPETSGYNAPEEFEGVPADNWQCLRDWGNKATDFAKEKVGEETVMEYRKGVLTVERGSFGRLIADFGLRSGNETLSRLLIREGYARSYGDEYLELERKARNNSEGLWNECVESRELDIDPDRRT